MSSVTKNPNIVTSQEENTRIETSNERNPIIFARTTTTHIPAGLRNSLLKEHQNNTIYSLSEEGKLRQTPTVQEEQETADTQTKEPASTPSFWSRLFSCCLPSANPKKPNSDKEPLIGTPTGTTPLAEYNSTPFLGEQRPCDKGKKTLVLDLDETLVHSSFQPTATCQYIIPVEIEGNVYNVYVNRRPWACEFIEHMSKFYEVVIYTASLQKYADPLLDQMDPKGFIAYRLFRDHCSNMNGVFVKDLGLLGRDLSSVIMIDNAAASFQCQPKNGIECIPFIDNFSDNELREMTPFLEYLSKKPDVRLFAYLWNDTRAAQSQVVSYKNQGRRL